MTLGEIKNSLSHTWPGVVLGLVIGLAAVPVLGGESPVPDHFVAFMYHHVSDTTPRPTSVSPDDFARHLDHLKTGGFKVWSLPAVLDSLNAGAALPDSIVVLTFDDGYRSVYSEAFPQLKELGWPFTVFVTTSAIDRGQGPVMTWDQLREMAGQGATIASHGQYHRHLQRKLPGEDQATWSQRVTEELLASRRAIARHTGQDHGLVAYPYGESDPHLEKLVRDLGWIGFGQQSGATGRLSDRGCLPRFPMSDQFSGIEEFALKAASLPLPVLKSKTGRERLISPRESGSMLAVAPMLVLELAPGDYQRDRIAAYASGQGRAQLDWLEGSEYQLAVTALNPPPRGRSRYNITAPATGNNRWYWFSHTWILGQDHQD